MGVERYFGLNIDIVLKYFIILVLVLTIPFGSESSELEIKTAKTELHLSTDRSIYIVGELLMFNAFIVHPTAVDISLKLYITLTDGQGKIWHRTRYSSHKNETVSGEIELNRHLPTGQYRINAFYSSSHNRQELVFYHKTIYIINPSIANTVFKSTQGDKVELDFPSNIAKLRTNDLITISKEVFSRREIVNLELKHDLQDYNDTVMMSTSVYFVDSNFLSFYMSDELLEGRYSSKRITKDYAFPHNISNPTLFIRSRNTRDPKILGIVSPGPNSFMNVSKLKSEESVIIELPKKLAIDSIYYYSYNSTLENGEIVVMDPFVVKNNSVGFEDQLLPRGIDKYIISLTRNFQIQKIYEEDTTSNLIPFTTDAKTYFYGSPDIAYNLSEYIKTSNLREAIKEFIKGVKLKKDDNGEEVIFFPYISSNTNPAMLMIDGLPCDNHSKALEDNEIDIARIEIVNRNFQFYNKTVGGLLNVVTKNDEGYHKFLNEDFKAIAYHDINESNIVDRRIIPERISKTNLEPIIQNTIFWSPVSRIGPGQKTSLSFYVGDCPGLFLIEVNGVDKKGKVLRDFEIVVVE